MQEERGNGQDNSGIVMKEFKKKKIHTYVILRTPPRADTIHVLFRLDKYGSTSSWMS